MADKNYKLTFEMSDGTEKSVTFTAPQGDSVTVSNVAESDDDGGVNTVTFSDGKEINVKNGKAGVGISDISIAEV